MKTIINNKIIFILIFYFFCISSSQGIQNKIILKINNEIVTSIDLLQEIEYLKILNDNLNNLPNEKLIVIAKKFFSKRKNKKSRGI